MAEESKRARNKAAGAASVTQECILHVKNNNNYNNWPANQEQLTKE